MIGEPTRELSAFCPMMTVQLYDLFGDPILGDQITLETLGPHHLWLRRQQRHVSPPDLSHTGGYYARGSWIHVANVPASGHCGPVYHRTACWYSKKDWRRCLGEADRCPQWSWGIARYRLETWYEKRGRTIDYQPRLYFDGWHD